MSLPTRIGAVLAAAALAILAGGCGEGPMHDGSALEPGPWRGWLDSPGGELPFELELSEQGGTWRARIDNAGHAEDVDEVVVDGERVVLDFRHFGATITARASGSGRRLEGEWLRYDGVDRASRMDFHATAGAAPRFEDLGRDSPPDVAVSGRWRVTWEQSENPAVAELDVAADGTASGTFLTTTGDYRWLEGRQEGRRLALSAFDGSHAFLFAAELAPDGSLAGDFWSRDTWHETWTAVRDEHVALPDPFARTQWKQGVTLADLAFPDAQGTLHALSDPEYAGKAIVLHCFGTWCPNCSDAAEEMERLDATYRERGLSIVGLAFERDEDPAANAERLALYAQRHGTRYPLLVAGLSSKSKATKSLRALDALTAFPTTIFLHGDGRVAAVHSGFNGPATGQAFLDQRATFDALVEKLLAEAE